MSFEITCPYCFSQMQDDEVLFRSERISNPEETILPPEYGDDEEGVKRFIAVYKGDDKEVLLNRFRAWQLFQEKDPFTDPNDKYAQFWNRFDGTTTEENTSDKILGIPAYHRPVIDPGLDYHRSFLKQQPDGGYLVRDKASGMVTHIELKTGEKCNRRVCPYCHNPLPDGYGAEPVKFVTVVGVTGSGKTVWLSQILKKMQSYTANVGLSATTNTPSIDVFRRKNVVKAGQKLPGSTPFKQFQQPLFYGMIGRNDQGERWTETLVLYDVAGELFQDANAGVIDNFAPFISHADGIVVLIDPLQIEVISDADDSNEANDRDLPPAYKALDAIHNIVAGGNTSVGCTKPVAVCLSQIDRPVVQEVLSSELRQLLRSDVQPIWDELTDKPLLIFNANEHKQITAELGRFMKENQYDVVNLLENSFPDHDYFAFTSLGCDVIEHVPVGPITPKRIEEPLYWLFYKLGYLGTNEVILPLCPICGVNKSTFLLPEDEREERGGLFRMRRTYYNYGCSKCGHKWL